MIVFALPGIKLQSLSAEVCLNTTESAAVCFCCEHSLALNSVFLHVNIYDVINFTSLVGLRAYAKGCLLCIVCIQSLVLAAPLSSCEVENDMALQQPACVY